MKPIHDNGKFISTFRALNCRWLRWTVLTFTISVNTYIGRLQLEFNSSLDLMQTLITLTS